MDKSVDVLLHALDEAFDRKAWHGTNLRGSIRGLSALDAAWRPGKGRHNIWEIVVHAAYWKYAVRRRLLEETRGSFPLKGSNWFVRPEELSEEAWREDIRLLETVHRAMRNAVAELRATDLAVIPRGSKNSNLVTISGIASHDVYHAGQIQLIKRLM